MAIWKQLLLAFCLGVLALILAARLSPGTADFLAGHGLSVPLRLMGLGEPAGPADAAGAPQAGKGAVQGDPTGQGGKSGVRGGARKATVVLQPAGSAVINDKVTALGTGAALQSVVVLPKANGTLIEIPVASGAHVTKGQVIARLDSDSQSLAREKAKLAAEDASRTLERNRMLVKSDAAPANQIQALELAAQMADLAVRSADQDLADRTIAAPIDGVLGILKVSVGNAVTPQTQIVSIEDSSALVVNFWLPERLAGQIRPGDAAALVPVARPDRSLTARITSIDNQIDPASGTFQIQAQVDNPDASLRPGMSFTVSMQFAGQSFVTVNPLSVQWGSGGAFVWRVTDGKAEKVPVQVVQRNTESVLVAGNIKPGDAIVTEGLDGLKPGADVQVFGAPPASTESAPVTQGSAGADGKASQINAAPTADAQTGGGPAGGQGNRKHKTQGSDAASVGN